MWKQWILIFVGGGLGSLLRFALGQLINPTTNGFPWATFTANLLGCFLFGLLGVAFAFRHPKDRGHFALVGRVLWGLDHLFNVYERQLPAYQCPILYYTTTL